MLTGSAAVGRRKKASPGRGLAWKSGAKGGRCALRARRRRQCVIGSRRRPSPRFFSCLAVRQSTRSPPGRPALVHRHAARGIECQGLTGQSIGAESDHYARGQWRRWGRIRNPPAFSLLTRWLTDWTKFPLFEFGKARDQNQRGRCQRGIQGQCPMATRC